NTNATSAASPITRAALSTQDRTFVNDAASGGMTEVELGRLAAQKGQNPEVKQFGERMVTDHSKANDELKDVAQSKNLTLPTGPNDEQQKAIDRLSKLSGAAFDREFMKLMAADHDKVAKAFQDQANTGTDPDIKSFAAKTLPTIQEHQKLAHD